MSLSDGVFASLANPENIFGDDKNPLEINIFDGLIAQLFNENDDQAGIPKEKPTKTNVITVKLNDGVNSKSQDFGNNDNKIIQIKFVK